MARPRNIRPNVRQPVLITGISGRLGQLLAQKVHRLHPVIGLDRRPFPRAPKDVAMCRMDIRSRRCEDIFRRNAIEAIIHLNILHDPRASAAEHHTFNVVGTKQLLEYCVRYKIPKFILLSTADLYGTGPRAMEYLDEGAPLMGAASDTGMRDLVEVDMLVSSFFWQHPDIETVVLRPVHILGEVDNAVSRYLRLPRIPRLLGYDPMVQGIHAEDVCAAIVKTLRPGARGVFNVTGPPAVPLSAMLRAVGRPVLPVPYTLFDRVVRRMFESKMWRFPPAELEHLRFGCMIDGSRIRRELGFEPQWNLTQILRSFQSERQGPAQE